MGSVEQQATPAASRCPRGCCASYREHLTGVTLGVTSSQQLALRQESKDMDAFARLAKSGVMPSRIEGCATLERQADTKFEVENASILTSARERRRLTHALAAAPPPATTPITY